MALKLRISRTYDYSRKNPIIPKLAAALKARGLYHQRKLVERVTGVAESTQDGWFDGETMNPITRTQQMILTGLGFEIDVIDAAPNWDLERELTKAARWNLENSKSVSEDALKFAKERLGGKKRAKAKPTEPKTRAYHAAQSERKSERRVSSR